MKNPQSPYDFLERPASLARGSVTTDVTNTLRDAIVSLALKPGEVLDKNAICDQLGVSRFPVSEALARLQGEGLVDILPQRGSIVSLVRIADVREYMLIRKALESEAVRALVGRHDDTLIADLRGNLAGQRLAVERDDRSGFHAQDLEFHEMLFDAMRFAKVRAVIESARANLDRARRLIITPRRLALSLDEHHQVFDAIVAGETERAVAAMRGHIDSVMAELLVFARAQPEIFADGETLSGDEDTFPFG
ncbi:GntR family transcriptional regulator [Youhaiella tibetensis]|uniref:GntR family transcriptional regulator n=1 Tax=Paradevosia tibetensis TaxID=1447062 RepID=A0A5B9DS71_9HYPH|nr:GntR family transcriptional regulator [Youhaiella tibetensis]QEE22047.1 GntR family transcriptional regulator [Youhaiella tibetensis]GGF45820.1 GntR family transcriptional regulator [Youhaiella tibetensis]